MKLNELLLQCAIGSNVATCQRAFNNARIIGRILFKQLAPTRFVMASALFAGIVDHNYNSSTQAMERLLFKIM